jgi:hypothetical protein
MKILQCYEFIKDINDSIIEKTYNDTCDALDTIIINNQNHIEGLVKMKIGDNYVYRVFDNTSGFFSDFKFMIPSFHVSPDQIRE